MIQESKKPCTHVLKLDKKPELVHMSDKFKLSGTVQEYRLHQIMA